MASISANGSNGHHKFTLTVTENSTSTANNTSSISFSFVISPIQTSWNWELWGANITYVVTINGSRYTGSIANYDGYSSVTLKSGSLSVGHNADGSKSISISFSVTDTSGQTYTCGNASNSGTMALTKIPRYATVTQTLASKTETSANVTWVSDSTIDYIWYSTDNGSTWKGVDVTDGKSGTVAISSLSANTTYNIKTRVRRKDSQLTTDSSALSVTTYNYPYCTKAPNFTVGSSVTLEFYNPLNRTFTMSVLGTDNSLIMETSTTGTSRSSLGGADSIQNLYKSIPNAKSGTYKVKVTYSGNVATKTGGTYSIKGDEVPTVGTLTYIDNNSTVVAITGNNQHIVQNYSTLVAQVGTATANKNASISKYVVECNGKSAQGTSSGNYSIGAIDSNTNVDLKLTVTDTRGLTVSKTIKVTMLAHSKPNATVTLERLNNYEDETYLTVDGSVSSVNSKNTMAIKYRYKVSGGSYGSYATINDRQKYTLSLNKNNAYIFEVVVTDTFGSTFTKEYVLNKGVFPLFIDTGLNSVGINGFPTSELNLFVNGAIAVDSGSNANGTWIKFYDGTMICKHKLITTTYSTANCTSEVKWTFPMQFKNLDDTRIYAQALGGNNYAYFTIANVNSSIEATVQLKGLAPTEVKYVDVSNRAVDVLAIGKWK